MNRKRMREYGFLALDDMEPYAEGADYYLEDGTPVMKNKESAQAFYDRRRDLGGPVVRVDPDGGLPSLDDRRRAREARHAAVRAKREKRERQRRDFRRSRPTRLNIKL